MESASALIRRLGLLPHPEGGYYREIHRSRESVSTRKGRRAALTTIFFLLRRGQKSVFHRVVSDEVWNYYGGAPLSLWRVSKDFGTSERLALGPPGRGRSPVAVIAAGEWQAAESAGDFTLTGCTVGPGFDFADFVLMRDDAAAGRKLRAAQPRLARFI